MRFLYFTDLHIKGVNPGKRKDVFYIAVLKKLMEIGDVIKNNKVDFVMVGGDLFDLPKISNQLLGEVAKIMKSWKVRVFVVPGNHDVYGQNISTLPHTSLGILERTGVITILSRESSPLYIGKRNDPNYPLVSFTGQEYYQEIDTGLNNDYEIEKATADYNILIAHGMLLDKPFHPDIAYTLMQNVQSQADLILSGHYHPDEVDVTYGTTRFVKPRGAARLEATKHNVTYMPQYVIVDIEKQNGVITTDCQIKDFTWAPQGSDIFDYDASVEAQLQKDNLKAFKEQIRSIDLTASVDLPQMIKTIAQSDTGVEFKHIESALKYLIDSEKNNTDSAVAGFIPEQTETYIKEVEITGFQSHEHTVINFAPNSLNALVGPSNNGKTAIIRAIVWCLYNEPKGTDFIKEGEKFASVTLKMSNGLNITRRRTNSDTGYYEIEDTSTNQTTRYAKFGTSIPTEVMNAHQMPKVTVAKDIVSLNVAKQLDGAFMLSMSGADRAAAIGKITKTDIVDNAILTVSKDISNLQRTVKAHEKDLESFTEKLSAYNYLGEEEQTLVAVENILTNIDQERKLIETYTEVRDKYYAMLIETNMARLVVEHSPDTEAVSDLIEQINTSEVAIQQYKSLNESYNTTTNAIDVCAKTIEGSANTTEVEAIIHEIEEHKKVLEAYISLQQSYSTVSASILKGQQYVADIKRVEDSLIEEIEQSVAVLNTLKEKQSEYEQCQHALGKIAKYLGEETAYVNAQDITIQETQQLYKEVLLQVGECPICGNILDEHTHFEL